MNVPLKYRNIIVFRALVGYFGIQGLWASVYYMPVGTSACIFFTLPIWSALWAYIFIKEKLQVLDVVSIFFAFAGVVIINRPWESGTDNKEAKSYLIGSAFALSGAMLGAFAVLCMRIMRDGIHYSISPFWFASGCTFWSSIVHIIQLNGSWYNDEDQLIRDRTTTVYDWTTIALIAVASIGSFFGQIFGSRAFQLEKAARIAALSYL